MASRNSVPKRMDVEFLKEINDMKLKRISSGKDPPLKPVRTARLTLAIKRHPLFQKIKQDIIQADLP